MTVPVSDIPRVNDAESSRYSRIKRETSNEKSRERGRGGGGERKREFVLINPVPFILLFGIAYDTMTLPCIAYRDKLNPYF